METAERVAQAVLESMANPVQLFPAPPVDKGSVRASSIGYGCLRHVQYTTFLEPTEEPTPEGNMASQSGWALEILSRFWLQGEGITRPRVKPIPMPSVPWVAHADDFVTVDGDMYIVEYKHMGYLRYIDLWKKGSVRDAHEQYYWQAQALVGKYLAEGLLFLAWPFDHGAVRGYFTQRKIQPPPPVYVEEIQLDHASQATLHEIVATVDTANAANNVLAKGFNPRKDWQCRYCQFRTRCSLDDVDEIMETKRGAYDGD